MHPACDTAFDGLCFDICSNSTYYPPPLPLLQHAVSPRPPRKICLNTHRHGVLRHEACPAVQLNGLVADLEFGRRAEYGRTCGRRGRTRYRHGSAGRKKGRAKRRERSATLGGREGGRGGGSLQWIIGCPGPSPSRRGRWRRIWPSRPCTRPGGPRCAARGTAEKRSVTPQRPVRPFEALRPRASKTEAAENQPARQQTSSTIGIYTSSVCTARRQRRRTCQDASGPNTHTRKQRPNQRPRFARVWGTGLKRKEEKRSPHNQWAAGGGGGL